MKQKFSTIFILLLLFLAGSRVVAQNAPKPFDIEQPSLRVFLPAPELATGRAVVACPGGGYSHLAFEHEGCDWAPYFNKQGIALIVLKYRMPNGDRTLPISDAEAAMKLVRDSADVWNLNPNDIGIMGSSAGGHLASTIATHAKPELRPNFQILFYPVITMDKSYTHRGSHDNLLGKDASAELELEYSNEKQVTKDTPRAFIVYSDDDKVVPPANGVNYYLALNKNNVPSVLHIYPSGGHGWGIREGFLYKNEMLDELTSWLRSFKVPHKDAIRVACIGNSITYGARIKNRDRDSYPAVLSRMLGEAYWVKNFGVSARTLLNKGDHPYMNEKTAVGDKYVYENMSQYGNCLGGEQSGHIIFSKHATTGDGILTSLKVMEVMLEKKETLGKLASEVEILPQVLKNVRVHDKKLAQDDPAVQAEVKKVTEILGSDGRILLRQSGTEPVVRVMVEAPTTAQCEQLVDQVIEVMKAQGHVL